MIPIKDKYKNSDLTLEEEIRIYKTKKSILDRSSGTVAQRIEAFPGEHCQKIAVSNPTQAGQRFTWSKTWCDRQQLGSNYWGYGYKTQHSYPRSR